MIYCPYTDRDLSELETSSEHIIPLSLGGKNGLELPVDTAFNSKFGSELDGALANEFLFSLHRTKYDARGHSGKRPTATIKRATYGSDNRPAEASFHHKYGVQLWDAQDREMKKGAGSIHINTTLNIDLPVRFTAKVALAAGYFVYGDLFRNHVDHRQLRDVMRINPVDLDPNQSMRELGLEHLTLRIDTYLKEAPSDPESELLWLRLFCKAVKGSVIVLMPGEGCFGVAVGILGQYLAMVNVPANTGTFRNEGDYAWGHVVAVVDRKIKRCSLVHALSQWVGIGERQSLGIPNLEIHL